MIEELDEVNWAALSHAYGSADDVPEMIRGLLGDERDEALEALFSSIAHQGTRYSASAPAVPFLLTLAADPATPFPGEIVVLLQSLATGGDNHDWRRFPIDALRAAGPSSALSAYDAVAVGLPRLIPLLDDADAEIAVPVAQLLAAFPEHADLLVPALASVAASDDAPIALTTTALLALSAVAPVGTSTVSELLGRRLSDEDESVRWAAAVAAVRLRDSRLLTSATGELRRWATRTAVAGDPWYGVREELAVAELTEADPAGHDDRIRPILARMLAETPSSNWHNHLVAILDRAGLPTSAWVDRELLRWDYLGPAQRELVEHLCERPDIFATDRVLAPLVWAGLPGTLAELRAFAGRHAVG
ncbi:hypothetical protein [Actinoplanes solisilvae]|uniref:hypothetical protein n=1 Tax=Actinoplanes solisilvae TaxID=2486853 RepID=UPI000FDB29A7|nr:hypothetical protein [Actinoplanes solisilvae]